MAASSNSERDTDLIRHMRPGGHYEARIVNRIPLEKILRGNPHRSFTVNFR